MSDLRLGDCDDNYLMPKAAMSKARWESFESRAKRHNGRSPDQWRMSESLHSWFTLSWKNHNGDKNPSTALWSLRQVWHRWNDLISMLIFIDIQQYRFERWRNRGDRTLTWPYSNVCRLEYSAKTARTRHEISVYKKWEVSFSSRKPHLDYILSLSWACPSWSQTLLSTSLASYWRWNISYPSIILALENCGLIQRVRSCIHHGIFLSLGECTRWIVIVIGDRMDGWMDGWCKASNIVTHVP
jgi:hypothetical protein